MNALHEPRLVFEYGKVRLFEGDCLEWLARQPERTIHGVVTDPPYGLVKYSPEEQETGTVAFGASRPPSMGTRDRRCPGSRP
jgi:DNA modification methylase